MQAKCQRLEGSWEESWKLEGVKKDQAGLRVRRLRLSMFFVWLACGADLKKKHRTMMLRSSRNRGCIYFRRGRVSIQSLPLNLIKMPWFLAIDYPNHPKTQNRTNFRQEVELPPYTCPENMVVEYIVTNFSVTVLRSARHLRRRLIRNCSLHIILHGPQILFAPWLGIDVSGGAARLGFSHTNHHLLLHLHTTKYLRYHCSLIR